MGGSFLDIDVDRRAAARYGLTSGDVQDVIAAAVGGMNVTTTVEGLERYPVNVRYPRALRDDLPALRQVLVPTPTGAHVPLGQLADFRYVDRPADDQERERAPERVGVRRPRPTRPTSGAYVQRAREVVAESVALPPGYSLKWSGQFEYMERANRAARRARPDHARHHLPAALPPLPQRDRGPAADDPAAVRRRRRGLADARARATTSRSPSASG